MTTDQDLKSTVRQIFQMLRKIVIPDNLQYVKDQSIDFCKTQSMRKAIIESVKLMQQGKYNIIPDVLTKALNVGNVQDLGYEY